VTSVDGTSRVVTVTINGANDVAVISGTSTGSVTEASGLANAIAGTPTATGTLTATDVDNPANTFTAVGTATNSTNGYGTYTMTAGGVWTYTLNNSNATVQALNVGNTLTDSFTVTSVDGTSRVVTVTINGANDAPTVTVGAQSIGSEDTQMTLTWASFGTIADADSATSSLSIRITTLPADGVLTLNGVAVTANQVISKANIDAGLLTFSPDTNESGVDAYSGSGVGNVKQDYANINYQVYDGTTNSTTATLHIDINPVADAPTLYVNNSTTTGGTTTTTSNIPASTGLTVKYFASTSAIDATIASNINTFEAAIESATPTSTSVYSDITVAAATATADNAFRITGYMYMEAGHTYTLSGYRDDTLQIKIGGTSVYESAFNSYGNFTTTTYSPTTSGYYSVEINYYNGDGPGALDINMSVDGGTALDFNTTNFSIYPSQASLSSVSGLGSEIVINDGGLILVSGGAEDGQIALGTISATLNDTDGSETLTMTISNIPVGAVLTDGTHTFTATIGNTSVNVTSWALTNISVTPVSNFAGTFNLPVGVLPVHQLRCQLQFMQWQIHHHSLFKTLWYL